MYQVNDEPSRNMYKARKVHHLQVRSSPTWDCYLERPTGPTWRQCLLEWFRWIRESRLEQLGVSVSYYYFRYPCFPMKSLEKQLQLVACPPQEESHVRQMIRKSNIWANISLILGLIFFLMNLYKTFISLTDYDIHAPPEKIFQKRAPGVFQFECIITNCSRLMNDSTGSLVSDFLHLPHISLCSPNTKSYWGVLYELDGYGYYFMGAIITGVLSFFITTNCSQLVKPVIDETLIYLVAPIWKTRKMHMQMRRLFDDLMSSMINFRITMDAQSLERGETTLLTSDWYEKTIATYNNDDELTSRPHYHAITPRSPDKQGYEINFFRDHTAYASRMNWDNRREHAWLLRSRYQHPLAKNLVEEYLEDCVPIVRTDWWRQRICQIYNTLIFFVAPLATILMVSHISIVTYLWISYREEQLQQLGLFVESQGCCMWLDTTILAIDELPKESWYQISANADSSYFSLKHYQIQIDFIMGSIYLVTIMIPVLGFVILYSVALIGYMEVVSWLNELRGQFQFAIEHVRVHTVYCKIFNINHKEPVNFKLLHLRDIQQTINHFRYLGLIGNHLSSREGPTRSKRLNELIHIQQLSIQMHQKYHFESTTIELLEKLYIKVRYFSETKDVYGSSLMSTVFYSGFSNYIGAFIGIYVSRHFVDFRLPYLVETIFVIYLDISIILAASFNTKVRTLFDI